MGRKKIRNLEKISGANIGYSTLLLSLQSEKTKLKRVV